MRVLELWRYPVKSMQGERLDQAEIGPLGVEGDRHHAVVDAETRVSLSAKRYAELLLCRARTIAGQVMIHLPDGSEFPANSVDAANGLSALLRRRVVVRAAEADQTVRHEFPTDLSSGEGETFIWEPDLQAFFDRAPLHLITTATLSEFSRRQPDSAFERARFRPNLFVEADEEGFVENAWVGRDLTIGSVRCRVIDHTARCVMTTRHQLDLPKDTNVMRTIAKCNDGRAGVELQALEPGTIYSDDPVNLLS